MSTYKNLMTVCCAAVLALGLAACGSSSDNDQADTGMDGDGMEMPEPAGPSAADLFKVAQDSRTDAMGASDAAAAAVTTAMENSGKLSTTAVGGDSATAMANAQAILDAQMAVADAVTDAQAALDAANAAKMDAEGLEDSDQKTSLIAALDDAIEAAEMALQEATDARDGADLETAVNVVTGGANADPQGTPRSIADAVGMDIAMALLPGTSDGRTQGTHGATPPADAIADDLKFETDDRQHMTWAQIVGEDNVMDMRVASGADDTNPVKAASVAGMTLGSEQAATTAGNTEADGLEISTNVAYKGIPGTVFCQGTDCKVEVVGDAAENMRKFVGSWYFTPDSTTNTYFKAMPRDTTYMAETLFTDYGYWLTSTGDPLVWSVNTFATSSGGTDAELGASTTLDDDDKATYSGSAAGMSVYKTAKADGMGDHIDSGHFTADVSLSATFGTAPKIRGTIDNFQGDAVGDWTVTLESADLATSSNDGIATATGRDGLWDATAYGDDTAKRPAGIFGGFSAHFSDGHAAGAYATRKD